MLHTNSLHAIQDNLRCLINMIFPSNLMAHESILVKWATLWGNIWHVSLDEMPDILDDIFKSIYLDWEDLISFNFHLIMFPLVKLTATLVQGVTWYRYGYKSSQALTTPSKLFSEYTLPHFNVSGPSHISSRKIRANIQEFLIFHSSFGPGETGNRANACVNVCIAWKNSPKFIELTNRRFPADCFIGYVHIRPLVLTMVNFNTTMGK